MNLIMVATGSLGIGRFSAGFNERLLSAWLRSAAVLDQATLLPGTVADQFESKAEATNSEPAPSPAPSMAPASTSLG